MTQNWARCPICRNIDLAQVKILMGEVQAIGRSVVLPQSSGCDSVSELELEEGWNFLDAVKTGEVLFETILTTGGPFRYCWPHDCLEHIEASVAIPAPSKPIYKEDRAIHDSDPSHHLCSVGFLAGHNRVR